MSMIPPGLKCVSLKRVRTSTTWALISALVTQNFTESVIVDKLWSQKANFRLITFKSISVQFPETKFPLKDNASWKPKQGKVCPPESLQTRPSSWTNEGKKLYFLLSLWAARSENPKVSRFYFCSAGPLGCRVCRPASPWCLSRTEQGLKSSQPVWWSGLGHDKCT